MVIKTPAALAALKDKADGGPVSWDFPVKTKGLTARASDDGAVELVDAKVDDHTGDPVSVSPLALSVKQAGAGRAVVTVTPDAKWLDDGDRVFPITIDPYAAATGWSSFDTTVQSDTVNTDLSTSTELKVGTFDGGTTGLRERFRTACCVGLVSSGQRVTVR